MPKGACNKRRGIFKEPRLDARELFVELEREPGKQSGSVVLKHSRKREEIMSKHVKGKYPAMIAAAMALLLLAIACGPSAQPAGEQAQQEAQKAEAPKGPAGKA